MSVFVCECVCVCVCVCVCESLKRQPILHMQMCLLEEQSKSLTVAVQHQCSIQMHKSHFLMSAIDEGWPEPYEYAAYDRIFGDFPAKSTVYTSYVYMVLANPNFDE